MIEFPISVENGCEWMARPPPHSPPASFAVIVVLISSIVAEFRMPPPSLPDTLPLTVLLVMVTLPPVRL